MSVEVSFDILQNIIINRGMPVIVTWQTSASTIRKQNIDWGGGHSPT